MAITERQPSLPPPDSTPFWYRRSFRNYLFQGAYLIATAVVIVYAINALDLREFGFGFLGDPAGIVVPNQWLIDYDGVTNSRFVMYLVAIWSSIRVMLVAIVFATIVGVLIGVARLSSNWLLARMAMLFVEIFRNTPLLVQIVLWYAILIVAIPPIQEVFRIGDAFYISNRGMAIPWPVPDPGWWGAANWLVAVWVAILAAAAAGAWWLRRTRIDKERETGQPHYPNRWAFAVFAVVALVSFIALGAPVSIDKPIIEGTQYMEGMIITNEFAALVLGLSAYTASFIAEIVRAGIQALPSGQSEAANAIGLTGYQRLTIIILPQALRQIIPSITNQYLNINKNSSLASAVLFADLFFIAGIFQNKTGRALEMFVLIIVTYMLISLIISAVMNVLNARVTTHRV